MAESQYEINQIAQMMNGDIQFYPVIFQYYHPYTISQSG